MVERRPETSRRRLAGGSPLYSRRAIQAGIVASWALCGAAGTQTPALPTAETRTDFNLVYPTSSVVTVPIFVNSSGPANAILSSRQLLSTSGDGRFRGRTVNLSSGGHLLGSVTALDRGGAGEPGITLGMDFLGKVAIGIDVTGKATIWAGGGIGRQTAMAWLGEGGSHSERDIQEIPIGFSSDGLPTLEILMGDRKVKALLAIEQDATAYDDPPGYKWPTSGHYASLSPGISIVTTDAECARVPWAIRWDRPDLRVPCADSTVQGTVSLDSLGGVRTIVDFPGRRIYVSNADPLNRFAMLLSRRAWCAIQFTGQTPRFDGPYYRLIMASNWWKGCEILWMAGMPASDLVRMAASPSANNALQLAKLLKATASAYVMTYRYKGSEASVQMGGPDYKGKRN